MRKLPTLLIAMSLAGCLSENGSRGVDGGDVIGGEGEGEAVGADGGGGVVAEGEGEVRVEDPGDGGEGEGGELGDFCERFPMHPDCTGLGGEEGEGEAGGEGEEGEGEEGEGEEGEGEEGEGEEGEGEEGEGEEGEGEEGEGEEGEGEEGEGEEGEGEEGEGEGEEGEGEGEIPLPCGGCERGVCDEGAEPPRCVDCLADEDCQAGVCHPERRECVACADEDDCQEGEFCIGLQCVPGGECRRNDDCDGGQQCDDASGLCVDCLRNGDCPRGTLCVERACRPGCRDDRDCPEDEPHCLPDGNGCATCLEDDHCGDAEACRDGQCVFLCREDDDCDGDQVCLVDSGECLDCLADAHCRIGEICEARQCVAGCRDDRDCGGDLHCSADGECVQCVEDLHCPANMVNGFRVCDGGACRPGCANGDHCNDGQICDVEARVCAGCEDDNDCPGETDRCVGGLCIPGCNGDDDCEGQGNAVFCGADALCVECLEEDHCGGALCHQGQCAQCEGNRDDLCPGEAWCDWISDSCMPPPEEGAGLCGNCGENDHCGDDGSLCVVRGDGTERFCGIPCGNNNSCPDGFSCAQVGDRGRNCIPSGLLRWGTTCAAHRDLGSECDNHEDCGLDNTGLCREGVCTIPCDNRRFRELECPEGYACEGGFQPSPSQDNSSCVPDE